MKNTLLQTKQACPKDAECLPEPFRDDEFTLLRHGIFDDDHIDVMINGQQDFAYLWPLPEVDYCHYVPRVKKLGLRQYKAKLDVYTRRFSNVSSYIAQSKSVLDLGAGDGLFLSIVKEQYPDIQLVACETDHNTLEERKGVVGDETFDHIDEIVSSRRTFSVVTVFHVLEHILEPDAFVASIRPLLTPESILIVEIPSLTCPLLTLYQSEAYEQFYFQRQHPFNYSHASLQRVMEACGFSTLECLSFQRYGLENHLQWLIAGKPGGNAYFREIFTTSSRSYITDLEQAGQTDSAIWVGKLSEEHAGETR